MSKKTKVLIRLPGCAGWSAPFLFAIHQRQVFSCGGPFRHRPIFWLSDTDTKKKKKKKKVTSETFAEIRGINVRIKDRSLLPKHIKLLSFMYNYLMDRLNSNFNP